MTDAPQKPVKRKRLTRRELERRRILMRSVGAISQGDVISLKPGESFRLSRQVIPAKDLPNLLTMLRIALELAASWLPTLPPEGVADRLVQGLDVLRSPTRDLPARLGRLRSASATRRPSC